MQRPYSQPCCWATISMFQAQVRLLNIPPNFPARGVGWGSIREGRGGSPPGGPAQDLDGVAKSYARPNVSLTTLPLPREEIREPIALEVGEEGLAA